MGISAMSGDTKLSGENSEKGKLIIVRRARRTKRTRHQVRVQVIVAANDGQHSGPRHGSKGAPDNCLLTLDIVVRDDGGTVVVQSTFDQPSNPVFQVLRGSREKGKNGNKNVEEEVALTQCELNQCQKSPHLEKKIGWE